MSINNEFLNFYIQMSSYLRYKRDWTHLGIFLFFSPFTGKQFKYYILTISYARKRK